VTRVQQSSRMTWCNALSWANRLPLRTISAGKSGRTRRDSVRTVRVERLTLQLSPQSLSHAALGRPATIASPVWPASRHAGRCVVAYTFDSTRAEPPPLMVLAACPRCVHLAAKGHGARGPPIHASRVQRQRRFRNGGGGQTAAAGTSLPPGLPTPVQLPRDRTNPREHGGFASAAGGDRTHDLRIKSPLLCQLSYGGAPS
jgi:hypothetical protein